MSYPAQRVRRRESGWRGHPFRQGAWVLGSLILIASGLWFVRGQHLATSFSTLVPSSGSRFANSGVRMRPLVSAAFGRSPREVYPYSVVPGGVRTPQELREASDHDSIVAAHYAGFDFRHAKVITVKQAKLVYVSYRMGNKVFWTGKRMSLRAGEQLITDGKITARARCGNQISEIPHIVTSPAEPSVETLDRLISEPAAPPVPFESSLLQPPGFVTTALPPMGGLPPGLTAPPPIGGGGCVPRPGHPCHSTPPPNPPPVNMAEPDAPSLLGSVLLFWLGVAGVWVHRWKMKARS